MTSSQAHSRHPHRAPTDLDDAFLRVVATCAAVAGSALVVTLWLRRIGW